MADIEPKRPDIQMLCAETQTWLDERFGHHAFLLSELDELNGDVPADLADWYERHKRWRVEHEEWAKRQPFNEAGDRAEWRMFGGEWLPYRFCVWSERGVVEVGSKVRQLVREGASEERLRSLAAHIYKHRAMTERSSDALIAALCGEHG